jgi:hypothetical protein
MFWLTAGQPYNLGQGEPFPQWGSDKGKDEVDQVLTTHPTPTSLSFLP